MPGVSVSAKMSASVDDVFRHSTNLSEWADMITDVVGVEILTDGEIGKGTRFRETRVVFGKEATEEMEITEFDPPHGFVLEAESCGTHYVTRHSFESTDDGAALAEAMRLLREQFALQD